MYSKRRPRNIARGDMFYVTRGDFAVGHEQQPGRPGIVVGVPPRGGATCMVVYLTTKRDKPDPLGVHVEINSAPKLSVALCDQIKTVDVRCLDSYCGRITDDEMTQVDEGIATALGLEVIHENEYDQDTEHGTVSIHALDKTVDGLISELTEAKEQAESWRRVALHLMKTGA
ncbi:MAG: type II toxin-antitoxin system PemK/MazF family toxin [Oscillospiraceae bacterium]|nr:type II toxin-antitoxin system PemK/MazF family toxin [Oscillospiraceae bacterium]